PAATLALRRNPARARRRRLRLVRLWLAHPALLAGAKLPIPGPLRLPRQCATRHTCAPDPPPGHRRADARQYRIALLFLGAARLERRTALALAAHPPRRPAVDR